MYNFFDNFLSVLVEYVTEMCSFHISKSIYGVKMHFKWAHDYWKQVGLPKPQQNHSYLNQSLLFLFALFVIRWGFFLLRIVFLCICLANNFVVILPFIALFSFFYENEIENGSGYTRALKPCSRT